MHNRSSIAHGAGLISAPRPLLRLDRLARVHPRVLELEVQLGAARAALQQCHVRQNANVIGEKKMNLGPSCHLGCRIESCGAFAHDVDNL